MAQPWSLGGWSSLGERVITRSFLHLNPNLEIRTQGTCSSTDLRSEAGSIKPYWYTRTYLSSSLAATKPAIRITHSQAMVY
jgi:hypothetical protein